MKKKLLYLIIACVLCSAMVFTACSGDSQDQNDQAAETEATETEAAEGNVTQADIEENIIGNWVLADRDGKPVPSNEKGFYSFKSAKKAYVSATPTPYTEPAEGWIEGLEADISIEGNEIIFMYMPDEETMVVEEYAITDISADEFSANHKAATSNGGMDADGKGVPVRFVKVNDDFSKDIIGTWEGHCTSEDSAYDDGKDHRWEYKDDGNYVYYDKNGDSWAPGDDTMNEYFVAGNLLCTRWKESDGKKYEWWEITIDGDTMNWTALRENEDGTTSTVTFEMTRVKE